MTKNSIKMILYQLKGINYAIIIKTNVITKLISNNIYINYNFNLII